MTIETPVVEETLAELMSDGLFVDGDWVESKDQDPDGEVRLIQLADIGDGIFRNRSSRFLTLEKAKELRCTFLEPEDVLIARMPEPLGRACTFPGVGQPAVTAVDVCVLRPNHDRARPEWLVKAINSPDFRSSMEQFVRGTTRQRISRKNLGTLRLRVPEVAAQLAVASFIDEVEAKRGSVGDHVSAARRAIELFRQAVLAAACSGRLTVDWRQSHTPAESSQALLERSRKLVGGSAVRQLEADDWSEPEWLDLPDSWRWAPLRELAVIRGGIQKQPKRTPRRNAYPYLRVANVQRGKLDLAEIRQFELFNGELDTYRLEPGDLLVVEGNGSSTEIGRSALWNGEIPNCVHQNHIIRVRCAAMEPRFVDLFWNSPIAAREIAALAVTSAGLYSLSTKKIGSVPVPVVPIDEQREIIGRAEGLLAIADSVIAQVAAASVRVERSGQAVLAKAFRGELVTLNGL